MTFSLPSPLSLLKLPIVKHDCGGSFLINTFIGRGSSIVKHDCGTAVAAFLSRTFGGPGILQSSANCAKDQFTHLVAQFAVLASVFGDQNKVALGFQQRPHETNVAVEYLFACFCQNHRVKSLFH